MPALVSPYIWSGCVCLLLLTAFEVRASGPYGADNGWAIDNSGHPLLTSAVASALSRGETGWIRIEMRLIPGHTNWDAAMLNYYDTAINNARNAGIQVLLLADGGSWPGNQIDWEANNSENNPGANGDNLYVESYATNAVLLIVQHFHDRVKYYELWNEPNAWTTSYGVGGTFLYPSNFGWLLARSWEAVHIRQQINDVTLFFGGVFGHNIGGVVSYDNAGAQYVDDTYNTGTNTSKGGSFAHTKSAYGAYPLDGVGQHIYLDPGSLVASNTFRQYEDWVRQSYTKYEGNGTAKRTFVTEFGWQTTNSSNANGVSRTVQDSNLVTAFMAVQAASYVQMAIWFQWQDNPAGSLWYGVVDSSSNPKLAYPDYQRFERFEGIFANGTTNSGVQIYFDSMGQAALGGPFDNGHGAWVYSFLNGYAQDYDGGSHGKLTLMTSTSGTFELNDQHGLWSFYNTNNGATAFGFLLGNETVYGTGTRQNFSLGYMTWDTIRGVVWYPAAFCPVLTATRQGVLSWTGTYWLQSGTNVIGPFTDVPGAMSPYTNMNFTMAPLYFRLRN